LASEITDFTGTISASLDMGAFTYIPRRLRVNTTGGNVTVTLPATPRDGEEITIIHYLGANSVIIDGNGNTITASATVTLPARGAAITLRYPGDSSALWDVVSYTYGNNITALTDSTGGTANNTLVAISGSGDDANINNNFADLAAKIAELLTS
jgi:hypothetical protein